MEQKTEAKQDKLSCVAVVFTEGELVQRTWIISLLQCLVPHFSVDLLTECSAEVSIEGVTNHYAHPHAINNESKPVLPDVVKQYIKRVPPLLKLLLKVRKTMVQAYKKIKGIGPLYARVNGYPQWGTPEFVSLVAKRCTQQFCGVVIAVDVKELIICHQVVTEVPIIYYSFELFYRDIQIFLRDIWLL